MSEPEASLKRWEDFYEGHEVPGEAEQSALIKEGVPVPWISFEVQMEAAGKLAPRLELRFRLPQSHLPEGEDLQVIVDELGEHFERLAGVKPTSVNGSAHYNYDPREFVGN